jgi:hypothetical protein
MASTDAVTAHTGLNQKAIYSIAKKSQAKVAFNKQGPASCQEHPE